MWFLIRVRKRRSRVLDMLFRLEIGLKLERLPGSRLGFLSKGVTRADLKQDGKQVGKVCNKVGENIRARDHKWRIGMKYIGDDLWTMLLRRLNTSMQIGDRW